MAKFVIYSYKLHLDPNGVMGSLFTEEEALSPKETLLRKQELFQRIILVSAIESRLGIWLLPP